MTIIDSIAYALDKLRITRRFGFYFTLWITYYSVTSCVDMAAKSTLDPMGVAAIIAAIMLPVTGLQAGALKFHHDGHKGEGS